MKRLILLGFAAYCGSLDAEQFQIHGAEIVGYGVFTSAQIATGTGDSLQKGMVNNVQFIKYTDEIPARLGTEFGFQFVIEATRRTRPIEVTYLIRFPNGGLPAPSGERHRVSSTSDYVAIGSKSLHGYGFDEPWEIVPGIWEFEVWHEKTKLIGKSFKVLPVDAESADDLTRDN